jgi:transcriptional regulator with XRE-family HTH domain
MRASQELNLEDLLLIRTVARQLRMLRHAQSMTQREVADRLNVRSQGYMSQLESGYINMTLGTVARLAAALGYDTEVTFTPKKEAE